MNTDETAARLGELLANGDLPKLAYKPFEFDDWGTVRVLPKSDDGFTDHFCQVRWPWADDDEISRHRIEKTDPWGDSAKALCLAITALPALLAERTAMQAEIARLRGAMIGLRDDLLERAEWDDDAVKVVCAGNGAWCRFIEALEPEPKDKDNDNG